MTQDLNNEINRELEKLDNEFGFSAMDGAMDELRKSFLIIGKKTVEAVRLEKSNNIGNTINESEGTFEPSIEEVAFEDGFNQAVTEQTKKAKEWLGEDV